jgi:hypothetical protein
MRMIATVLWLWSAAAEASPSKAGLLEGVVTSAPNGLAVPNVSITLRSANDPFVEIRTTDRDGAFRFEDLPAGLYSLEAWGAGFRRETVSPILVVPGVAVSEHVELLAPGPLPVPRPYIASPPRT